MRFIDAVDSLGIKRRYLIPDEAEVVHASEGIPASLVLDDLYADMPEGFLKKLTDALWDQGLIVPQDFLARGAVDRIRSALMTVVKYDALDIVTTAKDQIE